MIKLVVVFYWFDSAMALALYGISLYLYIKRRRGYMQPLVLFGLFIFPLQFSIWFLWRDAQVVSSHSTRVTEIIYLLFVKISLLLSLVSPQK